MSTSTISTVIALPYEIARRPLVAVDATLTSRLSETAVPRTVVDRAIGTADRVAGTVLPALPGSVLVFGGILLGAWIDNFERVSITIVVICGVLTLLAWATDYVAAMLGAKRALSKG